MSQPTGGGPPNDPYAELYRPDPNASARGASTGASRPLGGYQQPVSAPEDEAEGDRYGWLYRSEDAQTGVPPAPPRPAPTQRPAPAPPPLPPPPPQEQPEERRRSPWPIVMTVLVVAALMGVIAGVGVPALLDRNDTDQRAGGVRSEAADADNAQSPYSGDVSSVVPAAVATDCQAPPATDDAGNPVVYTPKRMFDGDKATAWRCDGTAEGEQVTFTLPAGTSIGEVGLVNGYTKVDPKTEADRYLEYRRITQVTWSFPDGTEHRQDLADAEHKMQTLRIPTTQATEVVLTIDAVTDPGQDAPTRDAVLIPEVRFGAPH